MTALNISDDDIPDLHDKVALITGGSSGIGYAAAKLLARRGAKVHILDLHPPDDNAEYDVAADDDDDANKTATAQPQNITYHACNITHWPSLLDIFTSIGRIDYVFANAGASEEGPQATDYFADSYDAAGQLAEPRYEGTLGVNLYGVLNTVKLAMSSMRRHGVAEGSIVITTSATGYSPELALPVYSAVKLALIGLIRALRPHLSHPPTNNNNSITLNGVAPAATITPSLPPALAAPILAANLPVSTSAFVARALVYSAIATEPRRVEPFGRESDDQVQKPGRWNGRVIVTLGERYTEVEEKVADLRAGWFGWENARVTRRQQGVTDFRGE